MNLPRSPDRRSGPSRISGIEVAEDRFSGIDGPAQTKGPTWGLTLSTEQIEYHLCPAITYELHYQLPRYVIAHMFNGARGRWGVDGGPLYESITEPHRTGLVPPGMAIRVIQDTPLEYLVLRVDPARFDRIAGAAAPDWGGLKEIFRTVDPALTALSVEMRRCMIEEPLPDGDYLDSLADALITRVVGAHLAVRSNDAGGPEMLSPALARRIADAIEDKLDGPIRVTELAEAAGLSRAHFSRAFARSFGAPPRDYVLSRRIARARAMLTDTDLAASDIAMRCGFASPSHLTTAFRKEMGLAPGAYRRALAGPVSED